MTKIKLVKFKDGSYAIRRRVSILFGYEYYDLRPEGIFWWSQDSHNRQNYCHNSDLDEIMPIYHRLTEIGKPI